MVNDDHWEIEPSKTNPSTAVKVAQESDLNRIGSTVFVVLFVIAIFSLLFSSAANLIAGHHIFQGLLILAIFGGIIPSVMEDLGWYLAQRRRLYYPAISLLTIAHKIDCTVFGWVRGGTHSMNAMRLAQVAHLRNRHDDAVVWAEKALKMSARDAWFGKFYANCVLGQIHYSGNNWQQAKSYLETAQDLFDANIGATPLAMLREKLRRFDVVNLDLLGRLALTADDVTRARKLFDRSYDMRQGLNDRKKLAESYKEYTLGLIAFHEFKPDEASKRFANALELLPTSRIMDYEEQTLVVEICSESIAHGRKSEAIALQSAHALGELQSEGLPPRLLELAAKPIDL